MSMLEEITIAIGKNNLFFLWWIIMKNKNRSAGNTKYNLNYLVYVLLPNRVQHYPIRDAASPPLSRQLYASIPAEYFQPAS